MLTSTFESQKRFALFHCTKTLAIDKEDVTKCGWVDVSSMVNRKAELHRAKDALLGDSILLSADDGVPVVLLNGKAHIKGGDNDSREGADGNHHNKKNNIHNNSWRAADLLQRIFDFGVQGLNRSY